MKENIVFGFHSVSSVLRQHPERVLRLCILKNRNDAKIQEILTLVKNKNIPIEELSRQKLDELSNQNNHQGIFIFTKALKSYQENDLDMLLQNIEGPPLLLILDGIQDPHNLGAIFRSADAFGVHAIIVPKDKSVGLTPAVIKVASGATETVPFVTVTNLARTMRYLREENIWLFGAAFEEKALPLYSADLRNAAGIVLGAEGTGLRRLTREHCDFLVQIPMLGSVTSLNVSVACGIFLYENNRQRRKN